MPGQNMAAMGTNLLCLLQHKRLQLVAALHAAPKRLLRMHAIIIVVIVTLSQSITAMDRSALRRKSCTHTAPILCCQQGCAYGVYWQYIRVGENLTNACIAWPSSGAGHPQPGNQRWPHQRGDALGVNLCQWAQVMTLCYVIAQDGASGPPTVVVASSCCKAGAYTRTSISIMYRLPCQGRQLPTSCQSFEVLQQGHRS